MKSSLHLVLTFSAAALGLVASARDASACSAQVCTEAKLLPHPGPTTLPANAPGIIAYAARPLRGETTTTTFTKASAAAEESVPFTRTTVGGFEVLVPTGGFEVGASYTVTADSACPADGGAAKATFTVTAAAPKPTTLGTLAASAQSNAPLVVGNSGACKMTLPDPAQTTVTLTPSADAAPWAAALRYETFVDGVRWEAVEDVSRRHHPGGSWKGFGKDVIYAACTPVAWDPNPGGVAPGVAHTVTMRASLPGDPSVAIESAPVSITLSCPTLGVDAGPTAPPSPSVSGAGTPASTPITPDEGPSTAAAAGCSASPSSGPSSTFAPLGAVAFGLGALVVAGRRRRR